jgi:hypothetical protein
VWDSATGGLLNTLEGHADSITAVALSSDGRTLVGGSWDATVKVWDVANGMLLHNLTGHTEKVSSIALSTDDRVLFSSGDTTVKVWEVATGRLLQSFSAFKHVDSIKLAQDGRKVLACQKWGEELKVWQVATGQLLRSLEPNELMGSFAVCLSLDGRKLVSGADSKVRVWEVSTGRLLLTLEAGAKVQCVAISRDGRTLVTSWGSAVKVWEISTGRLLHNLDGHSQRVNSVALSSDDRMLVSSSWDKTLKVWEVSTGRLQKSISLSRDVFPAVFSEDNSAVVCGSGAVARWDLATGSFLATDDPIDRALTRAAIGDPECLQSCGSTVRVLAQDGSLRARFTTLRGGHWICIAADGHTYTGSPGVEELVLLVEDGTNVSHELDADYIAAHRRESFEELK